MSNEKKWDEKRLIEDYSQSMKISKDVAQKEINEFYDSFKSNLKENGNVEIQGLGKFTQDNKQKVTLRPDNKLLRELGVENKK